MTNHLQPSETGQESSAVVGVPAASRISRALTGGFTALLATVLAAGVWSAGLTAIWAFISASLPILAEYWWGALILLLLARMVVNIVRPGTTERREALLRGWTSLMLLIAGVGLVAAPEDEGDAGPLPAPGRLHIEMAQAYGPGPYTRAGASQPGALSLISYVITLQNLGGRPTRAESVGVFVPSRRDGAEYRCAYPRVGAGLTLQEGDSLAVSFGSDWMIQSGWRGEMLPPGYARDAILLCIIDGTAERAAYTANEAQHRVVVVDSNDQTSSASARWSSVRTATLSGSRFEALADRVER